MLVQLLSKQLPSDCRLSSLHLSTTRATTYDSFKAPKILHLTETTQKASDGNLVDFDGLPWSPTDSANMTVIAKNGVVCLEAAGANSTHDTLMTTPR